MPLPQTEFFEAFLSDLVVSDEPHMEARQSVRLPIMEARDQAGRYADEAPLWLHYTDGDISLSAVIKRIAKELHGQKHESGEEICLATLAISALLPRETVPAIERLNLALVTVSADVNLYAVFNVPLPGEYSYDIPPFHIGPLRSTQLEYHCRRADSDYWIRYAASHSNSWAVHRSPLSTRTLNIARIRGLLFKGARSIFQQNRRDGRFWESLVNAYFSLMNRSLFMRFWTELRDVQDPIVTLGGPYLDPLNLQRIIRSGQIAVFLNIGEDRGGWVAPTGVGGMVVDLANAHVRVPKIIETLKRHSYDVAPDMALHNAIRLFARFVARARRHELDDRPDEALIHYVTSLELLFGERNQIQKYVAQRTAMITARALGTTFSDQQRALERIYESRSAYVHAGKSPADLPTALAALTRICEVVFHTLLRLQAGFRTQLDAEKPLDRWLKTLDYLAAAEEIRRPPTAQELRQAFIQIDLAEKAQLD